MRNDDRNAYMEAELFFIGELQRQMNEIREDHKALAKFVMDHMREEVQRQERIEDLLTKEITELKLKINSLEVKMGAWVAGGMIVATMVSQAFFHFIK